MTTPWFLLETHSRSGSEFSSASLLTAIPSFAPDPQFGFNTHVNDIRQLTRKLSALLCAECGTESRNRQLVPQAPLFGMSAEPLIENGCGIAIGVELFFCRYEV